MQDTLGWLAQKAGVRGICSLCFGDQEPLNHEFEELSRMVFEPLPAKATEEKLD